MLAKLNLAVKRAGFLLIVIIRVSDRKVHNYVDYIQSTKKRLPGKISKHKNSLLYVESSAVYLRWKEGKAISDES